MAEKEEENLSQFYQDYVEYIDSYSDLNIINAATKFIVDVAKIFNTEAVNPLDISDTSGLRKRLEGLVEFEKKYPFVKEDLSAKALELGEIKKYLEKRE